MLEFNKELDSKTKYVEEKVYNFLPKEEGKQKIILEAMNYSVKAGGKRLRPLLMLETAKLFCEKIESIFPFMAAIEMIHTYSLVHDDLPAMDNDEYRRGKKTTHAKYGEDLGILAGDGLLNLAYEVMSDAIIEEDDSTKAAKAFQIIAKKAGVFGMVGGQTVDIISEGKEIDLDTIMYIHNLKTAALIEASMMAGAVLGGADNEEIGIVEKIAKNIGIAFQIQDDILDITSTTEVLGKPVMSDEKNHKITYVSICGLDKSKENVAKYSEEAMNLLDGLHRENLFLKQLIIKLINREK
ncbi:MAG: polyprenyl synthetase family protein [Eubacterium sp.]|mgnify:CR=1 FL=1|nr:polyprenyl synthetase family protein [Eubacterium sp.]